MLAFSAAGIGAEQCFRARLKAGDRGAQLVGGVGEEPAHPFLGPARGPGLDDRQRTDDGEETETQQASAEQGFPRGGGLWQDGDPDGREAGHH